MEHIISDALDRSSLVDAVPPVDLRYPDELR